MTMDAYDRANYGEEDPCFAGSEYEFLSQECVKGTHGNCPLSSDDYGNCACACHTRQRQQEAP